MKNHVALPVADERQKPQLLPVHYYAEWPEEQQAGMRHALRNAIDDYPKWASSDLQADCILETIWNQIVDCRGLVNSARPLASTKE